MNHLQKQHLQKQQKWESAQESSIPDEVLEALLGEHLGDFTATNRAFTLEPFSHHGTNDSNQLYRLRLASDSPLRSQGANTTTWIVKHWKQGGLRDSTLGIFQSREALAWEAGWLHPATLPPEVVIPIVATHRSPDNSEAWVVMEDVSTELAAYHRMSLTSEQAIDQTRAILAKLAHFHVSWEQAARQPELGASPWLRRPEIFLWDLSLTYANALGRLPSPQRSLDATAPSLSTDLSADLEAFLEARPADEQRLWEHLMIERQELIAGLSAYPQTLLHGDLDDRNIGLRQRQIGPRHTGGATPLGNADALVLIDWEWIARGPAALDVANFVLRLPVMILPDTSFPKDFRMGTLADDYFNVYRAVGGREIDAASWRRSFGLALIAQGITQIPLTSGALRRTIQGDTPLPSMVGVTESTVHQKLNGLLPLLDWMEQQWVDEVRNYLE